MQMKEINKEEIENAITKLLEMAKQSCWNNISNNFVYILSNINEVEGKNFFIRRINRKKINERKKTKNLIEAINELNVFYENIYDINLFIYKTTKHKTTIEICYFLKSDLDTDFAKTIINNSAMLHCKIAKPPYLVNDKEKFDINCELGGIIHNWKMFLWKKNLKV
jgi:hypothetical protein